MSSKYKSLLRWECCCESTTSPKRKTVVVKIESRHQNRRAHSARKGIEIAPYRGGVVLAKEMALVGDEKYQVLILDESR